MVVVGGYLLITIVIVVGCVVYSRRNTRSERTEAVMVHAIIQGSMHGSYACNCFCQQPRQRCFDVDGTVKFEDPTFKHRHLVVTSTTNHPLPLQSQPVLMKALIT